MSDGNLDFGSFDVLWYTLIAEQHRTEMSISKIYGLTPKKIIKHSLLFYPQNGGST